MKNSLVLPTVLLAFFGVSRLVYAAHDNTLALKVFLAAISNDSAHSVHMHDKQTWAKHPGIIQIAPFEERSLKNPVLVPFISVRDQDRDAFVSGEPYTPEGALSIFTKQGQFCLWEDERGVQGAFSFNPENPAPCPREVCKTKKLFNSNIVRAALIAERVSAGSNSINLRLFVDKVGQITRADRV